jgi:hypothetical protein
VMPADLFLVCDRTPDPGYKRQQVDARACLHCILDLEIARALVALSINVKRTRVSGHGVERGRGEAASGEDHRDGPRRGGPVQLQVGRAEAHREGRGGR